MTPGIDIGMICLVLSCATAVHGLPISTEQVGLARIALERLRLFSKEITGQPVSAVHFGLGMAFLNRPAHRAEGCRQFRSV